MVINYDNYNYLRFEVPHLQIFENTSILMTVGEIRGNPPVIGNLLGNSNHSNEAYISWRWKTHIFKCSNSIFQSCENLPICFHIFCTNYENDINSKNNDKGQGLKTPNRGESPQFFGLAHISAPSARSGCLPRNTLTHTNYEWAHSQLWFLQWTSLENNESVKTHTNYEYNAHQLVLCVQWKRAESIIKQQNAKKL